MGGHPLWMAPLVVRIIECIHIDFVFCVQSASLLAKNTEILMGYFGFIGTIESGYRIVAALGNEQC
jgi:hypothetical protein